MNKKNKEILPHGVKKLSLKKNEDSRGLLMEAYRAEWFVDIPTNVQWKVSISKSGTLRGIHVHWRHHDFLCVVSGKFYLGLQDMRPWSPTYELATLTICDANKPVLIHIPPGIGHGFWFDRESIHMSGLTHYRDTSDELACRWDDKHIKIPWSFIESPLLSEKDQKAGTFEQMQKKLLTHLLPPIT